MVLDLSQFIGDDGNLTQDAGSWLSNESNADWRLPLWLALKVSG